MIEDTSKKFSPSKLDCYKSCPRQYRYRYIDKIPRKTRSVEAHLGSSVHAALEDLYEGLRHGRPPALEDVLASYEEAWKKGLEEEPVVIRDARWSLEDWRAVGRGCVESYYKGHRPFEEGKIVGIESRMGFSLDGTDPESGAQESYRVEGFLDRLMLAGDGTFEIHDYKTSKTLPSQAEQDSDWQLAIYDIAVREAWPDAKAVRLKWHFLRHGKTIVSTRTPEQLESLRRDILGLIRTIKRDGSFAPVKSALCGWCDYQDICPLWKHPRAVAGLPEEDRRKDSGVELADAYADIDRRKKGLRREIADIEERQKGLEERIARYCADNEVSTLEGTESLVDVRSREEYCFPSRSRDPEKLEAIEARLKASPVWPGMSRLDPRALMDGFKKRAWPREVLSLVEGWLGKLIHLETVVSLRVRRKREEEE